MNFAFRCNRFRRIRLSLLNFRRVSKSSGVAETSGVHEATGGTTASNSVNEMPNGGEITLDSERSAAELAHELRKLSIREQQELKELQRHNLYAGQLSTYQITSHNKGPFSTKLSHNIRPNYMDKDSSKHTSAEDLHRRKLYNIDFQGVRPNKLNCNFEPRVNSRINLESPKLHTNKLKQEHSITNPENKPSIATSTLPTPLPSQEKDHTEEHLESTTNDDHRDECPKEMSSINEDIDQADEDPQPEIAVTLMENTFINSKMVGDQCDRDQPTTEMNVDSAKIFKPTE